MTNEEFQKLVSLEDGQNELKQEVKLIKKKLNEVDLNINEMWKDIATHDRKIEKLKAL